MKDELGGKILTKIFGLRAKTYSYLADDISKCVSWKENLNYKNCLEATQLDNKIKYLEKK